MRRMMLPEVKIKSKLKDDVFYISIEELLTHSHEVNPLDPSTKSLIIQTVSQVAGNKDEGDGGIYIADNDVLNTDITNATLTITDYSDYININGLGINIEIEPTNREDVNIKSIQAFDVYIIKP